ncbi:MAG: nuclear transport factor 2 family protein [Gemmatimonadaceae bacterium]
MTRFLVSLLLGCVMLLPARAARAQTAEQDVLKVVRQLFDAMRQGDSAMARAVFHPEAMLLRPLQRDGQVTLRKDSIAVFLRAVGTPHAEVWDERVWNERVFVDGALAVAWMDYSFFLGPKFSHCGVDAFMFMKLADGWKITTLADTRRTEGCKDAPQ